MTTTRIDLQGVCEPMKFKSKEVLKEYLIDFHLQDYHEDNDFGAEDIALIKSSTLDELCDYFDWSCEDSEEVSDEN